MPWATVSNILPHVCGTHGAFMRVCPQGPVAGAQGKAFGRRCILLADFPYQWETWAIDPASSSSLSIVAVQSRTCRKKSEFILAWRSLVL